MYANMEGDVQIDLPVEKLKKWIEEHPEAKWVTVVAGYDIEAVASIELQDKEHRTIVEIPEDDD